MTEAQTIFIRRCETGKMSLGYKASFAGMITDLKANSTTLRLMDRD